MEGRETIKKKEKGKERGNEPSSVKNPQVLLPTGALSYETIESSLLPRPPAPLPGPRCILGASVGRWDCWRCVHFESSMPVPVPVPVGAAGFQFASSRNDRRSLMAACEVPTWKLASNKRRK